MMTGDNVVRLPRNKSNPRMSEKKWGKGVMSLGFSIVPSLLLRAQRRLGIDATQLAILMQICDFWWDNERKPYPGKAELAERLDLSPRQVQRHVAALETAGLVKRIPRWSGAGAKMTNFYDLSGLVARLKQLEPEFREAGERAKAARKAAALPKHRRIRPATGGTPT